MQYEDLFPFNALQVFAYEIPFVTSLLRIAFRYPQNG